MIRPSGDNTRERMKKEDSGQQSLKHSLSDQQSEEEDVDDEQQPEESEHQQQHHSQQQQQSTDNNNKPKRNPFCSRCRNHGKSAQVKGHKRHCEYRDCQCEGCKLVECRQIVSAAQIKRRRNQKQDEECGRRIEISPPVLTREPSNDPATLIAKTLIGPGVSKLIPKQMQHLAQQHSGPLHSHHLSGLQGNSNSADISAITASLPSHHQHHHHLAAMSSAHQQHYLNHHHTSSHHQDPQLSNSAFGSALHLLNYPVSMLSQAAAAANLAGSVANPSAVSNTHLPPPSNAPPLPSLRDQISLVDEIHQVFGPLAIYAWLKAEHFDLQKVRDLIETSRASYNSLLDLESKYRLNNNHAHNHTTNTTVSDISNSSGSSTSSSASSTNSNEGNNDRHHQRLHQEQYLRDSVAKSPVNKFNNSKCSGLSSTLNRLSTTTSSSSSSPLHTLASGYNNNNIISSSGSASNNGPVSVVNHYNTPLNPLPTTSVAQSLLWSGLKLTNGVSNTVIHPHPHHLLSPFMHHPFMPHHHHHHHQHQQLSPTMANSSTPASSSTVL